jgi:hypothetical protein
VVVFGWEGDAIPSDVAGVSDVLLVTAKKEAGKSAMNVSGGSPG